MSSKKCKCCCVQGCDVCLGEFVDALALQATTAGAEVDPDNPLYEPTGTTPNPMADCDSGSCCDNLNQTVPLGYVGSTAQIFFTTSPYRDGWALIEALPAGTAECVRACEWNASLSSDGFFPYWTVHFTFLKLYATLDGPPILGAGVYINVAGFSSEGIAWQILPLTESGLKVDCSSLAILFDDLTTEGGTNSFDYCAFPSSVLVERVA